MDIEAVLDCLQDACVYVWLDTTGKPLIDKDAPAELKDLVRAHKRELIDVRRAQAIMNRPGMRCLRLPLGELAVAYPLKSDIEEIRWAMRVLRMDLPLVLNDEGLKWLPYSDVLEKARTSTKMWAELRKMRRREPGPPNFGGAPARALTTGI